MTPTAVTFRAPLDRRIAHACARALHAAVSAGLPVEQVLSDSTFVGQTLWTVVGMAVGVSMDEEE